MPDVSYLNQEIFSVTPPFDIAMTDIYMDEEGWRHLMLGHRDLRNGVEVLRSALSQATSVHALGIAGRFLVRSTNVISSHGKPMGIVVERDGQRGRAFTASRADHAPGTMIWESSSTLYTSYDNKSDVLYFSKGTSVDAYVSNEENFDHIWLRTSEVDNSPVGVTVFDFKKYWLSRKDDLIRIAANFLRLLDLDITNRIDLVLRRYP